MAKLSLDFTALQTHVGDHVGFGPDVSLWQGNEPDRVQRVIDGGMRHFYFPLALPGERQPHQWKFLTQTLELQTNGSFTTGTVAIAAGVVTLTSTATWPTWAANGELTVSGISYPVSTRDSNTQLTLVDTSVTVAAGAQFILLQDTYELSESIRDVDNYFTYHQGESTLWGRIQRIPEHMLRIYKQRSEYTGYPQYFAMRTRNTTNSERYEILFWPAPDNDYRLIYRGLIDPDRLDSGNLLSLAGSHHAQTIKAACIWEAETYINDNPEGPHKQQFIEQLITSVGYDRDVNSADTLGYNGNWGRIDDRDYNNHFYQNDETPYLGGT